MSDILKAGEMTNSPMLGEFGISELVAAIFDQGKGKYSCAIGMWDDKPRIGLRWNGTDDNPIGNPQSRGLPAWFMLPLNLHEAVIEVAKKENPKKAAIMSTFLSLEKAA